MILLAPTRSEPRETDIVRRMPRSNGDIRANEPEPLLPKVSAGDESAVSECLERYGGLVWSLARRLSTTEADAEDAVQDIFLDVWKSAGRFDRSVASEVTFVAMIARRRLIDRRRREGRRPKEEMINDGSAYDDAPIDIHPANAEDVDTARRALTKLSPEQQRVLQLSIFHGLSHERIARATELPLGTVKTHARRGLIRVRELIEADRAQRSSGSAEPSAAGGAER